MPPEAMRFGIIGTGGIADNAHAPALGRMKEACLWSVLSRDQPRAADFAAKHKAAAPAPAHASLETFLADPQLQAVIITSPDKLHAEHIIACAQAGKHVLVEKPMVTRREDGDRAIEACRNAKVKLATAFHLRWHAGHRKLRALIRNEKLLGDIRHIRAQWVFRAADNSNWRADDELGRWWTLAATGSHCIDLIHWFAPASEIAERKSVVGRQVWGGSHDETAVVAFHFKDGVTAESISSVVFEAPTRLEIYGSKDYAVCEGTLGRHGKGTVSIGGKFLEFAPANPFEGEIRDLVDAVREDRAPEVSGEDGIWVVDELIAAAG